MDRKRLNKIWDILVKMCGANEEMRKDFLALQTSDHPAREFRFMGNLGFGGKVWFNNDRVYVNFYREDHTPEREAMAEKANEALMKKVTEVCFVCDIPFDPAEAILTCIECGEDHHTHCSDDDVDLCDVCSGHR